VDIFFGPSLHERYAARPLTLVDIGARGGLQPNWAPARRHLRVIGFEPDPEEHARLAAAADPRSRVYINAALHREPATLALNVGRDGGTSSLLEPNLDFLRRFPDPRRYEVARRVPVQVDTLDRVLPAHDVRDPDFIKIDTQGAELAILEGGREVLTRSVLGVEVEVLFAPLYRDQPPFGAIDALLRELGYQLFDLRPSYWKRAAGARYGGPKGQLVFGDALYLRTEASFQRQLEAIADDAARCSKLLRALSVCLLYGYFDYAIELFEPNRALLGADAAAAIATQLRTPIPFSARLPHFRGRGWLSHFFYRLHRALYPAVGGWGSGGRNIGNVD
jgi:FkbM family methyltransferase